MSLGRGFHPKGVGTVWSGDMEAEFATPWPLILSRVQTTGQILKNLSGWPWSLNFLLLKQMLSYLLFCHCQSTAPVFTLLLLATLHLYPFHRRGV